LDFKNLETLDLGNFEIPLNSLEQLYQTNLSETIKTLKIYHYTFASGEYQIFNIIQNLKSLHLRNCSLFSKLELILGTFSAEKIIECIHIENSDIGEDDIKYISTLRIQYLILINTKNNLSKIYYNLCNEVIRQSLVRLKILYQKDENNFDISKSAYLSVTAARSRNISVVATMNRYGMIYHKIREKAANGKDIKLSIKEINQSCQRQGILTPIFVMENARIHHFRELNDDEEIASYLIKYLPLYSPFLNQFENVFSFWKNEVIRDGASTEPQLTILICEKFNEINERTL
ncbi:putative DDE endonuclease, partial [Hamiltosporidium magnivora]